MASIAPGAVTLRRDIFGCGVRVCIDHVASGLSDGTKRQKDIRGRQSSAVLSYIASGRNSFELFEEGDRFAHVGTVEEALDYIEKRAEIRLRERLQISGWQSVEGVLLTHSHKTMALLGVHDPELLRVLATRIEANSPLFARRGVIVGYPSQPLFHDTQKVEAQPTVPQANRILLVKLDSDAANGVQRLSGPNAIRSLLSMRIASPLTTNTRIAVVTALARHPIHAITANRTSFIPLALNSI